LNIQQLHSTIVSVPILAAKMKSFLLAVSFVTGALAATQAVPDNVQWLSLQARSYVDI
jgi:hypothetical protein